MECEASGRPQGDGKMIWSREDVHQEKHNKPSSKKVWLAVQNLHESECNDLKMSSTQSKEKIINVGNKKGTFIMEATWGHFHHRAASPPLLSSSCKCLGNEKITSWILGKGFLWKIHLDGGIFYSRCASCSFHRLQLLPLASEMQVFQLIFLFSLDDSVCVFSKTDELNSILSEFFI